MPAADFVEAGVALVEAGIALPGAAWSRLTFAGTELRIHYTSERLGAPPIGSHLDLGATNQVGLAVLDLARARLRASQSDQLLALSFRFSDLSLRIDGAELTLVGSTPECSLAARPRSAQEDLTNTDRGPAFADQVSQDRRPVLVVEFPPQHLFEEASFRPGRSALPDVVLNTGMIIDRKTGAVEFPKDKPTTYKIDANTIELDPDRRSHVVDALDVLARSGKPALLRNVRMHLLKEKAKLLPETAKEKPDITEEEKKKNQAENFRRKAFADFARKVARLRRGLSNVTSDQRIYIGPFAMDVDFMARVRRLFDLGAIARARAVIDDMFAAIRQERQRMGLSYPVGADLDAALKVEVQLQAVVPLYQQFRTFYRDQLLASFSRPGSTSLPAGFEATSEAPGEVEYIDFASDHPLSSDLRRKRLEVIRKAFIADLQGAEALEGPKRGRLANHSRLAFRVNCLDVLEAAQAAQAAQLDGPEDAEVRLPRRALHFDLNELLQFRGMELAVTARAEIPYEPDAHGRIGGRAVRLSDISPGAMMARLGFTRGPNTSVAIRLAEIAASLRAPTAFETAIEMPARVTLSPHQNAVVLTPQQPEGMAQVFDLALGACSATTGPATGAVVRRLWAARFVTGQDGLDLDPGLRAVHSPDLRPGALLTRFAEREKDVLPMTQPPGGPLDPWFLSGTQSEATPPTLQELNALFSGHDDVCEAAANPAVRDLPGILRAFCHRVGLIRSKRRITFRNGLDARDRHQLVMLSSAWGLPIKYAAQGDTKPTAQPEPEWQLWDVLPGNGIYAPRSLDVTELTLTTLGGVLRHDTGFEPPTAPLFWRSRDGVYDAFSVERWQHWINLGRDIFTEVVYKGFLLPLGIRASLVKVTEREFWIDPKTGAITAPLRQRMFIRVARPEKLFPAVRQPSNGRCFPIRRLELLTTVTPDIVDPYSEAAQNEQSEELPSGRLLLKGARGLVFWPRTLKARQGDIRFEMTVDGIRSDLPLIFADQTAINDQVTMNALVAYYARLASPAEGMSVEPINHRRTLQLRGAAMRYAPEVKAGSASFQTEHWTLHATGGANAALPTVDNPAAESGTLGTIAMHNDDFNFDAVRQANDQPPIYPAIASARMYLTQTERLIGRRLGAVDTYFDGAFVRDGLGETEQKENSAEVVLVLAKGVALKMGDKGDQSGGIFRPAGHVVGLSRAKGALTLDNAPTVPPVAGMNYTLPLMSPLFDERKIREAASAAEMRFGGKASERKPSGTELEELRKYYQSLLSSDAKICGLVSVKELIGLCQGLGYPIDDAPALTEALEFGAAGKAGAEQIRKEIIIPLAAAIRSVREEWAALEQRINDELARGIGAGNAGQDADKKVTGFEIRKVFPELYQSLADLEAALVQAESETDPVLFGFELGACYSAGMRFLGALERAASNPGQALEALVSQTFAGLLALVDALRGGLKKYFDPLFENLIGDLDAAISEVIEDGFKQGAPFIRRAFLSFPQPYIGSATAPDKWQHCLEGFVPGADDAEAVLTAFVKHALLAIAKGGRLDAMTLINDWLDDSDAKIEFSLRFGDSLKELRQRLNAGIKALADAAEASIEADSASEALSVELDAAVGKLKKALDEIFFLPVGDADDFIASGPPREQICKRYISGVLVAMAEADMTDCITGLPLGYPRQILDFLSGLNWKAPGALPDIDTDLTGWFDPISRAFNGFLGDVGLPLPDCATFNSLWQVIQAALNALADVTALINLVPTDWQHPTRAETLQSQKYDNPQELLVLPGATSPSVVLTLLLARAYLVRINADMGKAEVPVTQARDAIARLPGDAAAKARDALQMQLNNSVAVRGGLNTLRVVYESAFDAVMRDAEALRRTVGSMRRAAKIKIEDACSGKIPADDIMALANLPRDVQALVVRREHMLRELDKAVKATREQLDELRETEMLVPLFADLAAHFDELGLPESSQSELPDWATGAQDQIRRLQDALAAASEHVVGLADSLKELLCQLIALAGKALDVAKKAQDSLSESLSETAVADLPPEVRQIGERMRRVWNAQQIAMRLEDAGKHLIQVREMKETLCAEDANYPHLGAIEEIIVQGASPFSLLEPKTGMPPLAAARAEMRGVEDALKDIAAELRLLLEAAPREAAETLLLNVAARVVALQKDVQPGNPLASQGKLGIVPFYERLKKVRGEAWEAAGSTGVLSDKLRGQLTVARGPYRPGNEHATLPNDDRLAGDVEMLAAIRKVAEENGNLSQPQRLFLHAFLQEWGTGQATPLLIGGNIAELVQDLFAGKLYRFIDFARLRKEFEGRLLALVPTKQKLDYTFGLPLGPEVNAATMGIFRPAAGCQLGVGASIEINLAGAVKDAGEDETPLVSGSAVGTLGAFEIKLVGDLFDALTLRFGAARFEAPIGGTPRFEITYLGHTIGEQLKFVEKLQAYLSPKDGSGAILRFDPARPGVEAGYRLQLGDFAVGNLAFTNVGLEATAVLPFSDEEAVFKASLSSRASPFTLTYAPYGGSGFFAILANVQGVIGFEASFEFGGSGVFAFGPLTGQGRLMSGVYIRQLTLNGMRLTEISMTFFAGGSASIWIFNFTAALSVQLGMVNGNMSGQANFSFSFSMGLCDYKYSISVSRSEGAGFSGEKRTSSLGFDMRRFAGLGQTGDVTEPPNAFGARIENRARCQGESWNTYKSYFIDREPPEEYF
ncbi:hypothetical protein PYTT13_12410 [Paracoccus yeei]|uniref:Uncharacterized protein n=2 Tax=Paracoccus yeei TaxID=147645 RepID=A0A2D2C203_9RHOB|nr:hypothetical protein PYTT13_12410 [Paracoccus yeei]